MENTLESTNANSAQVETVEEFLDSLLRALEERKPSEVVEKYDHSTVMFTLAPPLKSGSTDEATAEASIQEWLDTFSVGPTFETAEREVVIEGDMAFAYGFTHMVGKKTDGEKIDLWYRETNCLKRMDGQWQIIHQHESVPFYMDGSQRAALDLNPESKVQ